MIDVTRSHYTLFLQVSEANAKTPSQLVSGRRSIQIFYYYKSKVSSLFSSSVSLSSIRSCCIVMILGCGNLHSIYKDPSTPCRSAPNTTHYKLHSITASAMQLTKVHVNNLKSSEEQKWTTCPSCGRLHVWLHC